jgi:pimeloyl-ACP methyl ester carboxylesterase
MTVHPLTLAVVLIVVATLPPLVHMAYASWVRRRYPIAGDVIVLDGARLHYTRCGEGPAVVLVHGANGTWNDFPAELIAELARDHTVVALDRPGHGWSDAGEGRLGLHENIVAVVTLLQQLGLTDVTLVGHSYGAAVAMGVAIEAPALVSHVVAVTPCTAIDRRNARYATAPIVGEPAGLALFHFVALALLPLARPLRADAWHPERAPHGWSASRLFAYIPSQMHASARNFRTLLSDMKWLEQHLPRLVARLTVLAGESDRVTPPARHVEWLRRAAPDAHFVVLRGVGHWLVRLRPDVVAAAVRRH